jgi:hypothetical protein
LAASDAKYGALRPADLPELVGRDVGRTFKVSKSLRKNAGFESHPLRQKALI